MKQIPFLCSVALSALSLYAETVQTMPPWLLELSPDSQHKLYWQTEPEQRYDLWESTDLKEWLRVDGFPKVAEGLAMEHAFDPHPDGRGFFSIEPIDEQPPVVVAQYPPADGFAVGRFSDLAIELEDASGIDPDSIRLTVGGTGPLAPGAPGLTIEGNTITWDSGDAALGDWGETVTATLVVADTPGNELIHTWSFRLEPEPVVAENIFVFGSPTAQRAGQRVRGPAAVLASRFPAPAGPAKANDPLDWSIDSVVEDRIVIAYGGGGPPAFTVDQLVCNLAPEREDEIFYRKILSISNNPTTSRLTLMTEGALLPDFIIHGSAALSSDSMLFEIDESGNLSRALSFNSALTFPRIGRNLSGTGFKLREDGFEISVDGSIYTAGDAPPFLECEMSEFSWWFTPRVRAAFELQGRRLKSLEAIASGQVESTFAFVGRVISPLSAGPWTLFDLPAKLSPKRVVYMQVGLVPVWGVLSFDFEIEAEASAQGAMEFHALSQKSASASFGVEYEESSGLKFVQSFQSSTPVTTRGGELTAEASLTIRLEPEMEFILYGLAGFEAGIEPSATLAVKLDPEPKLCFETSLDFVLEPEGPVFDRLGITGEFRRNITSSSSCDEFAFTRHPASQTVEEKADAIFECVVDAPEGKQKEVKFQWHHNGTAIPGQTGRSLFLQRVKDAHAGSYHVTAALGQAVIESDMAVLMVGSEPGPVSGDFALIPAGLFFMGDSAGGGWSDEQPVHLVYVGEFYMEKYEVTKLLWDEVRTWGMSRGYSMATGDGKGVNHPVYNVSWYDAVKWCNARSEREGLMPCYTVNGAVYRSGSSDNVACNWNAGGYRLPTEAEWEKAARGGWWGERYPWGDLISHGQANYHSSGFYHGNLSGNSGYHPLYATGEWPFTSPVGSFLPNDYDLYDVSGNVEEWCWDWFSGDYYGVSPDQNPSGPPTGSLRVLRGGGWNYDASTCRVAYRFFSSPDQASKDMGFRVARSSAP